MLDEWARGVLVAPDAFTNPRFFAAFRISDLSGNRRCTDYVFEAVTGPQGFVRIRLNEILVTAVTQQQPVILVVERKPL